jgi:hypothetical protein
MYKRVILHVHRYDTGLTYADPTTLCANSQRGATLEGLCATPRLCREPSHPLRGYA